MQFEIKAKVAVHQIERIVNSGENAADHTKVSINTALGRMRYAILNLRKMAEENNIVLTL